MKPVAGTLLMASDKDITEIWINVGADTCLSFERWKHWRCFAAQCHQWLRLELNEMQIKQNYELNFMPSIGPTRKTF